MQIVVHVYECALYNLWHVGGDFKYLPMGNELFLTNFISELGVKICPHG